MPVYIALLRGINVSGHKPVKMERLRAALAELGCQNLATYIQSGNVVFTSPPGSLPVLTRKIEAKILTEFGFAVPVFLTTAAALAAVLEQNPLLKDPTVDPGKLHVTFLSGDPPATARELLQPLAAPAEQLRIVGPVIYLYCPAGYGQTRLANGTIEKKLAVGATTRNWQTVNKLLAMAQ